MHRKEFFKKGLAKILDSAITKSEEVYSTLKNTSDITTEIKLNKESTSEVKFTKSKSIRFGLKFPPGAITDSKFENLCTGCEDCINACPYNVLFPVMSPKYKKNIPYLDPNVKACMLCKDWPCIDSCEVKALMPLKKKNPNIGKAKGFFQYCVNSKINEQVCSACKDSCPVKSAVKFHINQPIFQKNCVGCGICVQACPTFPKAIVIN